MSFPCFFAIFVTVKSKQMAGNDCCIKRSAIILRAFMLFFVLWYFNIAVRPFEGCIGSSQTLHYTLNYLLAGLIPTWALFLLHARRDIASSMGLSHGFGTGLLFAVTATLPMSPGSRHRRVRPGTDADAAFTWIFIAGIFEELVYRGFVFGQLFRYAPLGVSARGTIDGTGVRIVASLPRARPGIGTDGLRDYGTGQHFFQLALCRMELQPLGRNLAAYSDEPALDSVPRKYERRRRRHRGQRFAALHHNPGNRPDCCIQAETGTTLPNTDQYINYQQDTKCVKSTSPYS